MYASASFDIVLDDVDNVFVPEVDLRAQIHASRGLLLLVQRSHRA